MASRRRIDDLVRTGSQAEGQEAFERGTPSLTDPDAKIARMKDGSSHLAFKPEHAVDLDTGVVVAAPIRLRRRLATRRRSAPHWKRRRRTSPPWVLRRRGEDPSDLVADKGYHSRDGLKALDGGPWKTRIAETETRQGLFALAWRRRGARGGVCQPQPIEIGRRQAGHAQAGEMVERSFAHVLDRGGMRRAWLRGRLNVHKRYLIHVAGFNLGILMRVMFGQGTPRQVSEPQKRAFVLRSIRFDAGGRRHLGHRR